MAPGTFSHALAVAFGAPGHNLLLVEDEVLLGGGRGFRG
jgi:hypothetical protein